MGAWLSATTRNSPCCQINISVSSQSKTTTHKRQYEHSGPCLHTLLSLQYTPRSVRALTSSPEVPCMAWRPPCQHVQPPASRLPSAISCHLARSAACPGPPPGSGMSPLGSWQRLQQVLGLLARVGPHRDANAVAAINASQGLGAGIHKVQQRLRGARLHQPPPVAELRSPHLPHCSPRTVARLAGQDSMNQG